MEKFIASAPMYILTRKHTTFIIFVHELHPFILIPNNQSQQSNYSMRYLVHVDDSNARQAAINRSMPHKKPKPETSLKNAWHPNDATTAIIFDVR